MITRTLQTLIDRTPPKALRDARRMPDAEVADDPRVRQLRAEIRQLDAQQLAARDRAAELKALLDALPARRDAAEEGLVAAKRERVGTAAAGLRGADDKPFFQACYALRKAEFTVEMFELGICALETEYQGHVNESGRLGRKIGELESELVDMIYVAKIERATRQ